MLISITPSRVIFIYIYSITSQPKSQAIFFPYLHNTITSDRLVQNVDKLIDKKYTWYTMGLVSSFKRSKYEMP